MSDFPKEMHWLIKCKWRILSSFYRRQINKSVVTCISWTIMRKKFPTLELSKWANKSIFFRTMHQVWNNNVKQVRNIKLAYLPGLQKRTSMDGCNISSAPSSHLTKTLDEILWCSEPQNFLLKCICSISCKTNHENAFNF